MYKPSVTRHDVLWGSPVSMNHPSTRTIGPFLSNLFPKEPFPLYYRWNLPRLLERTSRSSVSRSSFTPCRNSFCSWSTRYFLCKFIGNLLLVLSSWNHCQTLSTPQSPIHLFILRQSQKVYSDRLPWDPIISKHTSQKGSYKNIEHIYVTNFFCFVKHKKTHERI